MPALQWDLFCRVVDNLGDAGVCWRLAADLAARGQRVRLVIDDPRPLSFMAPQGAPGVQVWPWPGPAEPGDVVIEAFGCDPPPAFVQAMAARDRPPVWINLEHLSAEGYVERSHGLPSPQPHGLMKWFFFPGFTPRTGGLLREPGLIEARAAFDRSAWLAGQGIALQGGERLVTLFCYDNPAMASLLDDLARRPTLLLLTPGPAQAQVPQAPAGVRLHRMPWMTQAGFDRLLWASELNFVRGEDSLVRALWAGAPFVWQLYPQHDGAHRAKLEAMLARMGAPSEVAAVWRAWNASTPGAWPGLPALPPWRQSLQSWREALLSRPDLTTALLAFVNRKAGGRSSSIETLS
ncbi:MAG: elongation factor P maturation arginine rhamnosyltransferase EarP [Rubrivivax sp.]|nr:elongation factor P maturation arginine rhamnosyltransferase EarP [Rubrivivax sp.]